MIKNHPCYGQCRLWGTLIRCCLRFVQWRSTRNPVKDRDPTVYGQMEPSNTSLQTTDLNPNYSGQTNSNKPGSGQWVVFSSNDNSSNDTSSTSFCLTTFGPISKKRSLVKGTLTLFYGQKVVDEVSLDEKSVHKYWS